MLAVWARFRKEPIQVVNNQVYGFILTHYFDS
jgi:hypothetical protein